MDKKTSSVNDLVVTYVVAVVSVLMALVLGAYTFAAAIAKFADVSAGLPSIFGVLGGGSVTSIVVGGAMAVIGGVIAHLAMKEIATSADAGKLVASDNYALINKLAKAFCFITAGAAIVGAVVVLMGALFSITDYTPWKSYLLGECLPFLFVAGGLVAGGVMIDKFVKAEIKPNMLAIVALSVGIAGLALGSIAVIVNTHVNNPTTTIRNTYQYLQDLDY